MPKELREKFKNQKNIRYREETGVYEIRKQIDGVKYFACSTSRAEAVRKFIKQLQAGNVRKSSEELPKLEEANAVQHNFGAIVEEWLNYKKKNISYHQWQNHASRAERFLPEEMRKKQIEEIKSYDMEPVVNAPGNSERMSEELRSLFNQIFKFAIANGIISYNPVMLIPFVRAGRENREALSEEQIVEFLLKIREPKYDRVRQCAYVMYFFGVRPCEIDKEARFENGFLICRNRKRKNGKIEYKKIPIPGQARGLIDFNKPITFPFHYNKVAELLKSALGEGLTPYNLRHTYASICAEYVRQDIIEVWMGDSPERLVGKTYVHFPDSFMQEQIARVKFITL